MSDLARGQKLHRRFTLLRPLGRGGMADVWLVRDAELDEEVAAKIVVAGAGDSRIAALQRECRAARRLSHPNIVPVFDFHPGERYHLITMAHVEGDDLRSLRGAVPQRIARLLVPVADALEHAHRRGVIHRDLKATNVLVDDSECVWLLDFGIGALLDEDETIATAGGGSRYNVSPQQLAGEPPDASDDVYAFGVLLYELISGAPPFWPDVTPARVREERPAALVSGHPVPAELVTLVSSLLAKSPADRPAGMRQVRVALERLAGDPSHAPAPATGRSPVRLTPPPRARPVEPIAHPSPPPVQSRKSRPMGGVVRPLSALVGAAATIGLLLYGVFVLLPSIREGRDVPPLDTAAAPIALPAAPPTTAADAEVASARDRARELLQGTLPLRRSLEERGAMVWGASEIAEIDRRLEEGDDHMGAARYVAAEEAYAGALRDLQRLEAGVPDEFERAIGAGAEALADRDAATAIAEFGIAGSIVPGNEIARTGLRRAETLDELIELLDEGNVDEQSGRFEEARESYERAVALDPLSEQAQAALARIDARLGDDRFAHWMSRGLAALRRGEHRDARQAFEKARALRPDSPGVFDGLLQADAAEKLETISRLRREALSHEVAERWSEAVATYTAAIELDASIVFAQEGEVRTRSRADLAHRLDFHIAHPERLTADAVFDETSMLLDEAQAVEPAGPRHRLQVDTLEAMLNAASRKIRVVLESDDETDVTVYRVGHLGRFRSHELDLRPGTYTVIGSRAGYRDVRRTLVVGTGAAPEPLVVRCAEKI